MRGLGSRLAVFALALATAAAGARSLGAPSPPSAAASCTQDALPRHASSAPLAMSFGIGERAAAPNQWTGADLEGSGKDRQTRSGRPDRSLATARRTPLQPSGGADRALPCSSTGLLGLVASSPANAPPGS